MNHESVPTPDAPQPPLPEGDPPLHPQIWIGSLLDYNNGILHGDWVDAARPPAAIHADIATILATSPTTVRFGEPAEEWGIFDHDNFGAWQLGEYESIERVSAVACGIAQHGPAFAAWAEHCDDDTQLEQFEEAFLGEYESAGAFAEQLIDDLGYQQTINELPEPIRRYLSFDLDALAADMRYGGDIHIVPNNDGRVWIFDARM